MFEVVLVLIWLLLNNEGKFNEKKAGQTLRWLFLSMFLPCALRQTYVTEGFAKGLQVHRQGCLSVALF